MHPYSSSDQTCVVSFRLISDVSMRSFPSSSIWPWSETSQDLLTVRFRTTRHRPFVVPGQSPKILPRSNFDTKSFWLDRHHTGVLSDLPSFGEHLLAKPDTDTMRQFDHCIRRLIPPPSPLPFFLCKPFMWQFRSTFNWPKSFTWPHRSFLSRNFYWVKFRLKTLWFLTDLIPFPI